MPEIKIAHTHAPFIQIAKLKRCTQATQASPAS